MLTTPSRLIDNYHRNLNYLRVSITDRCNLHCIYCEPQKRIKKLHHDEVLRYEEFLRIIRVGVNLGINKVRVTGGEPLVRKGVDTFLFQLGSIKELYDISLTTNGTLLKKYLDSIQQAGIKRINISIDSLKSEKFQKITGFNGFNQLWETIIEAHERGFNPIKLNMVVLGGINDDEIEDLAKLSFDYPFHIRFIEYMPVGPTPLFFERPVYADEILDRLAKIGKLVPVRRELMDGPATRLKFKDAPGEVGIISPISHHFCDQCNRLRLTADGHLRPCLLCNDFIDIKNPIRSGISDNEIAGLFLEAARNKPASHHLVPGRFVSVSDQMSSIGG